MRRCQNLATTPNLNSTNKEGVIMRKQSQRCICALSVMVILSLTGCAYDGSQFQYQSGGLPFLGMSVAIGHDSDNTTEVRTADGRSGVYAPDPSSSVLSRIPDAIRRFRAPTELNVPEGPERSLTDKYDEKLNAF